MEATISTGKIVIETHLFGVSTDNKSLVEVQGHEKVVTCNGEVIYQEYVKYANGHKPTKVGLCLRDLENELFSSEQNQPTTVQYDKDEFLEKVRIALDTILLDGSRLSL